MAAIPASLPADSPPTTLSSLASDATQRPDAALWQWTPATGEFYVSEAHREIAPHGTLAAFLAGIADADQNRVTETLAAVAQSSAHHFDISYDLRDPRKRICRMRTLGHVIDRDADGTVLRVAGVTLHAEPRANTAKSAAGRNIDLEPAFEGPHQGV